MRVFLFLCSFVFRRANLSRADLYLSITVFLLLSVACVCEFALFFFFFLSSLHRSVVAGSGQHSLRLLFWLRDVLSPPLPFLAQGECCAQLLKRSGCASLRNSAATSMTAKVFFVPPFFVEKFVCQKKVTTELQTEKKKSE
jgi:hypothetical protein